MLNISMPRSLAKAGSIAMAASFLAGAACSSVKAPQSALTASHAAIRAAEELKATDIPKANLHLQMAKENTERAEKLMNANQNEEATFVLMRAQSDAELALALAKEAGIQKDSQLAVDKVQKLQTQISK